MCEQEEVTVAAKGHRRFPPEFNTLGTMLAGVSGETVIL
jgi:hypothetical protein